ncbi:MAG: hypothetical protein J6I45_07170 [Clostridia bacterium]|nr:hypothetical protein [Clostridia bacterium]
MNMKKLNVTFAGTTDTTGYLFSLVKSLSAALRCSEYSACAEDIVATSGFAFRMWINSATLCPSATSIWEFKAQKSWVESGGLTCDYAERLWGEDAVEAERRQHAIEMIKASIDSGTAAVAWDISGCEWGIICGYDEDARKLLTLKIDGSEGEVPYEKLGKLDLPILSVLTVTGRSGKESAQILSDTKKLALSHLRGEEWCDNAKGIAAYDALIAFVREKLTDNNWNLEYNLGTYAALKWYAWHYFERYGEVELAELYRGIHTAWQAAFELKRTRDVTDAAVKVKLIEHIEAAKQAELRAMELMEAVL